MEHFNPISEQKRAYPLWNIADKTPDDLPKNFVDSYYKLLDYLKFLTTEHPHRNGDVCPFVRPMIDRNNISFSYNESVSVEDIENSLVSAIEDLSSKSMTGFWSHIVLFSDNLDVNVLQDLKTKYKAKCMLMGIMLGVMHPKDDTVSLHSDSFFPFKSPTNILVFRNMVSADYRALDDKRLSIDERISIIDFYITKFSKEGKGKVIRGLMKNSRKLKILRAIKNSFKRNFLIKNK